MSTDLYLKALEEELYRRKVRKSLPAWAEHVLSPFGQHPVKHHRYMMDALEQVADGSCDRLIMQLPPGSAKSTYASQLFPAWFMAQRPDMKIIGASHTQELSEQFSSIVRRFIEEHSLVLGYKLRDDSRSKELWETSNGGQYKTASVGGSVTGFRADLVLIDDPTKGREAAESANDKEKVWKWFANDVLTRLKPGGRIIICATRWAEDDLIGRVLEVDGANRWKVIRLPALAEPNDPLNRAEGQPLWPEWESLAAIEDKRRTIGERDFQSLFQQNPRPLGGGLFHTSKIHHLDVAPCDSDGVRLPHLSIVRGWDLSATAGGDYTVGVKIAKYSNGTYVILDVKRMRGDPSQVEAFILATAKEDGNNCRIDIPQDPGSSGLMVVKYLTSALSGYDVTSSRETGDKEMRAKPVISQVNVGNFSIVKDHNSITYLDELAGFPGMKYDDCCDATSRAFNALVNAAKPARMMHSSFMAR